MDGEAEYTFALNKYDELAILRNDPSFWADNLVQATKDLKNPIAWRNFYSVLGNSDHVYSDEKGIRTLNDWLQDHTDGVVDPADECHIKFKERRVQNGNVTHIMLTPDISNYIEKHAEEIEPMDCISEELEEEKSWKKPARQHEISRPGLPKVQVESCVASKKIEI